MQAKIGIERDEDNDADIKKLEKYYNPKVKPFTITTGSGKKKK
jgi:hypothetical protein